ncbi:MAG: signal peptidase I [Lachnospiraceae bacterium]|nr:signal peptidase I [Lachnospiraceae bacterium]
MEKVKKIKHYDVDDHTLITWLLLLCLVATFAKYLSDNYVQLAVINGDSMLPAYHNMQIAMVDKHSKDYEAGDVIVFYCQGLSELLVKRVVGVPGDILRITDGTLYINGIESNEDTHFEYAGILEHSIELAEDEYIVLGDNTSSSRDGRYEDVGIVKGNDIIGEIR